MHTFVHSLLVSGATAQWVGKQALQTGSANMQDSASVPYQMLRSYGTLDNLPYLRLVSLTKWLNDSTYLRQGTGLKALSKHQGLQNWSQPSWKDCTP